MSSSVGIVGGAKVKVGSRVSEWADIRDRSAVTSVTGMTHG
ncbi:MAG: hypothetical protein QOF51_3786 [Chloroflexota bacterium]|jgi:hypothetical protein|nr:hypothetical protein [Chloroflexota bacterium]